MQRLGYYRRRASAAVSRMRTRGYSLPSALLLHFPRAALLRGYRKLAVRINRAGVFRWLNARALRRLHGADRRDGDARHFYVIVMPGTLHFLLPCLALLPDDLRVSLLANGARRWELRLLESAFPHLPICRFARMPGSSISHGDVITLLLNADTGDFGLLDHDCYVFDRALFADVTPGPRQCLTAVYGGVSRKTGLVYPETYFLYLNSSVLRQIMARYHVDARIYRAAPAHVRAIVGRLGLGGNVYYKDHATFFDTLHLMLGLALADGFDYRFLQHVDEDAIAHVGGTSWKTQETKELVDCYIDWRFLELVGGSHERAGPSQARMSPLGGQRSGEAASVGAAYERLRRRYAQRLRPFRSSADVRAAIPMTPEAFAKIAAVDRVVDRLQGRQRAGERTPAPSRVQVA